MNSRFFVVSKFMFSQFIAINFSYFLSKLTNFRVFRKIFTKKCKNIRFFDHKNCKSVRKKLQKRGIFTWHTQLKIGKIEGIHFGIKHTLFLSKHTKMLEIFICHHPCWIQVPESISVHLAGKVKVVILILMNAQPEHHAEATVIVPIRMAVLLVQKVDREKIFKDI